MKRSIRIGGAAVCALAISAAYAQTRPADTGVPHLEKRGVATQLIVDGKPFLVLGAEPPTSGASNLEYLRYTLQVMATTHQNTAAIAVAWAWIEPEKGKYDFRIVDAAIEDARKIGERIVLVWFGSWKNGQSNCAPGWVKADQDRFPRAQVKGGQTVEALSPLNENNWEADARVFAVLMRHIREVDRTHRVIMVQVENEIGIFGDSRDRSPLADKAFAGAIPAELMDYLQKHKEGLHPELRKVWEAAGFKTNGTWQEVFGKGPEADEIFMAWNYARYVNHVADAGKKEYPVPMFANTWGSQGWGKGPHGEPMDHVHDIWKAGAPMVDTFAPDAYMGMQGVANHIVDLTTRTPTPAFRSSRWKRWTAKLAPPTPSMPSVSNARSVFPGWGTTACCSGSPRRASICRPWCLRRAWIRRPGWWGLAGRALPRHCRRYRRNTKRKRFHRRS